MNRSIFVALVAWAAFGTWAEARRSAHQKEIPALRPGIEADLAARQCPDLRIDTERFRAFSHAHDLTHADFFTKRRTASLQRDIDAVSRFLHARRDVACAQMWARYGSEGTVEPLLARR